MDPSGLNPDKEQVKPLSKVKAGQTARVVRIEAGASANARLASMGLVPRTQVSMISNGHPGPMVVSVKGAKMMLGRGMAHKIMVCAASPQ
ncbi:MAG TPA: ferrous iron transport protein A [Phycisphaerales bacterium]|nr:ferrous iron transport protein A [Phycisphaerales bacterium]